MKNSEDFHSLRFSFAQVQIRTAMLTISCTVMSHQLSSSIRELNELVKTQVCRLLEVDTAGARAILPSSDHRPTIVRSALHSVDRLCVVRSVAACVSVALRHGAGGGRGWGGWDGSGVYISLTILVSSVARALTLPKSDSVGTHDH
jgi:hypothetical protein